MFLIEGGAAISVASTIVPPESRIPLASRDVEHGLRVTLAHFTTRAAQERALDILQFKLDILWSMLDAIEKACHEL